MAPLQVSCTLRRIKMHFSRILGEQLKAEGILDNVSFDRDVAPLKLCM